MPWRCSPMALFRWFLESMNHDFQYFVAHYLCGFYQLGLAGFGDRRGMAVDVRRSGRADFVGGGDFDDRCRWDDCLQRAE